MAKIDESTRLKALREHMSNWIDEIEEIDDNKYELDGEEYLVLTEDEAKDMAKESIKDAFNDMGLELFDPKIAEYICKVYVEDYFIDELAKEYAYGVIEDAKYNDEEGQLDVLKAYKICHSSDEVEDVDFDEAFDELEEKIIDNFDLEEYGEETYGRNWMSEMKDILADYLDVDGIVDYVIKNDGVENTLATYDGKENEVKIDGEYLYLYRTN